MDRPDYITDEMLAFLDDVRDSGQTNMFGAVPYIMREFPDLLLAQAKTVRKYWMATFEERDTG